MAAERKVDGCPFSWRPQEKRAGTGAGGGERKRPSRIPISTKYEIRKFLFRGGRDLRNFASFVSIFLPSNRCFLAILAFFF